MFQIRSSWARFLILERFVLLGFSITYVFSTRLDIPTPPASKLVHYLISVHYEKEAAFSYLSRAFGLHCVEAGEMESPPTESLSFSDFSEPTCC